MRQGSTTDSAGAPDVVARLLEVESADPLYRDLYLQRARSLLAPLLSDAEYHRLKQDRTRIDDLLRQGRSLEGRLRALVGGHVRFGGAHDLCSIGREDARENVVTRLAVVRRTRLLSGPAGPVSTVGLRS